MMPAPVPVPAAAETKPSEPDMTAPSPVMEAIRAELRKLVEAPDLGKNLVSIAKVSNQARMLMMALTKGPDVPMVLRGDPSNNMANPGTIGELIPLEPSGQIPMTPIMPVNMGSAETMGTKAIREIIAAIPGIYSARDQTPEQLVHAIAVARENGMTDLSAELEKKLLGKPIDGDRPIGESHERLMNHYLGEGTPSAGSNNGTGKVPEAGAGS